MNFRFIGAPRLEFFFRQDVLIRHKETVHNNQTNQLKGIDFTSIVTRAYF